MISTERKIEICSEWGDVINKKLENGSLEDLYNSAKASNPWFTKSSVIRSLNAISRDYLDKQALQNWINNYSSNISDDNKRVGLVMAGNIPAVGFHDLLSVFISNHKSLIKYSSKDDILIPFLLELLFEIAPEADDYFETVVRLKDYDAVIATGGNNTSRYFEFYFKDVPHLIRRSRSGVAILTGNELDDELMSLGDDIFSYFGLGCRNVSKIYIPREYNLEHLLEVLHQFNEIILHHKYKNNFDFNIALFLLNKQTFLNNGSIILKEDQHFSSRIACVHYEYYDDVKSIGHQLKDERDKIQCIVSSFDIDGFETFNFGQAQSPALTDYADGIDTMQFLLNI